MSHEPRHDVNNSSQPPRLPDDPTVEEIRAIRRRLWQQAGGDIAAYIRQAREAADRILAERKGGSSGAPRKSA